MTFDRDQFIEDLRYLDTLDVKWTHQGRTPETGMDCVFAPRWAIERQGIVLPEELAQEFEHYRRPPDGQRFLSILRKWLIEIPVGDALPGDLLVIFVRRNPCHLAVKMPDGEIAEAYESMDGSVSRFFIHLFDTRNRIAAAFRIPDFA